MPYGEQAVWFLNGFWNRGMEDEKEVIFKVYEMFSELDDAAEQGCELDEHKAHRFLELLDNTMTVVAMRKKLREIDQDANGQMALLEYLVFRYGFSVEDTANAPQGDNSEELAKAKALFDEVMKSLNAQRQVLAELEEAKAALQAAEDELQAAIDELNAQEEAYHGAIAAAEEKSTNPDLGVVKRNRAAAELAQLKAEDPLPLRRAKITQEASLRKVGKEKKKVEAKEAELEARLEEASAELERASKSSGSAEGAIWFMQKQEHIADTYLPKSKMRFDHSNDSVTVVPP